VFSEQLSHRVLIATVILGLEDASFFGHPGLNLGGVEEIAAL